MLDTRELLRAELALVDCVRVLRFDVLVLHRLRGEALLAYLADVLGLERLVPPVLLHMQLVLWQLELHLANFALLLSIGIFCTVHI